MTGMTWKRFGGIIPRRLSAPQRAGPPQYDLQAQIESTGARPTRSADSFIGGSPTRLRSPPNNPSRSREQLGCAGEEGVSVERRRSPRRPVEVEILVHYPSEDLSGFLRCRTRDISDGGMFLVTGEASIPANERLEICFAAPGEDSAVHELAGYAVREEDEGVGLRFEGVDRQVLQALRDLMRRSA